MRHIDVLPVRSAVPFTQLEFKQYLAGAVSVGTVNLLQQSIRNSGQYSVRLQIKTLGGAQCVYGA